MTYASTTNNVTVGAGGRFPRVVRRPGATYLLLSEDSFVRVRDDGNAELLDADERMGVTLMELEDVVTSLKEKAGAMLGSFADAFGSAIVPHAAGDAAEGSGDGEG